jgi:histidine triad (HIT) family protein
MATIFTKIAAGEIPSYKVAEDERFYAFLDINPLAVGHTLVIPMFAAGEREANYIFDLDDDTLGRMMLFAKRVAAQIRAATGCARVAVVVIGLEVPHVHIHLIPINSEADVDFRAPRVCLTPEEFASVAAKIASI